MKRKGEKQEVPMATRISNAVEEAENLRSLLDERIGALHESRVPGAQAERHAFILYRNKVRVIGLILKGRVTRIVGN